MQTIHPLIRVQTLLDQDILHMGVQQILKAHSFIEVTSTHTDAHIAMEKASQTPPQVFITYAQLSSGNPYQLAKHFQKHHKTKTIFLTSHATSENETHHAIEHGVLGILNTNCSGSELLAAIQSVAKHKTYFTDRLKQLITQTPHKPLLTPRRHRLSPREIDVLRCLGSGLRASQISDELSIAVKTVDRHKSNIMTKLGLYSQVHLALYAVREGVTPL
ncbi:MAG: DNA-binding response regulator [Oligoflexales bacterium]